MSSQESSTFTIPPGAEPTYLLTGKVAIVTGSSRGIGREVALELARRGASVVVNYSKSADKAEEVVNTIKEMGGGRDSIAIKADTGSLADIDTLFKAALSHFGSIDIVVSNAGINCFSHLGDTTEAEFDSAFGVNTKGQYFVAQAGYRHLREGGRIVLMSSKTAIDMKVPNHAVYAGSKAAINVFVKYMALDCGDKRITVNAVAPGGVWTDMAVHDAHRYLPNGENMTEDEVYRAIEKFSPLKRWGQAPDIARVVAFLVSEDGGWVNGKVIGIDGGA